MLPLVVLAGGLATRLRPVTDTMPKSLIGVNGLPFVLHQLELFKIKGFSRVHFCLGYLGEMVEETIKASKYPSLMDITFSYDGEVLLGTGGAIRKVVDQMDDLFFITYGDSYLDVDYNEIESNFNLRKKDDQTGLMTIFKNDGLWDRSNVWYDDSKIVLYSKNIKLPEMRYIDYGIGILSKNNFFCYGEGTIFDLAEIYENLSVAGNLLGFEITNRFYEVGSFEGLADISNYLKTR